MRARPSSGVTRMRARLLSIHQPKNVCGEVLGYCNLASTVVCCHTNMTVCVICVLFTSCTHVIVQATFHRSALVGHWTFDAGAELRDLNGQICCCCSVNASIFDCRTLKVNGIGTTSTTGWAVTNSRISGYRGSDIAEKMFVVCARTQSA